MTKSAMTPPEAAKVLRVSADKIVAWIRAGELVAVNVASKQAGRPRWRIMPEAFDDFIASREATPKAARQKRRPARPANVIEFF